MDQWKEGVGRKVLKSFRWIFKGIRVEREVERVDQ